MTTTDTYCSPLFSVWGESGQSLKEAAKLPKPILDKFNQQRLRTFGANSTFRIIFLKTTISVCPIIKKYFSFSNFLRYRLNMQPTSNYQKKEKEVSVDGRCPKFSVGFS